MLHSLNSMSRTGAVALALVTVVALAVACTGGGGSSDESKLPTASPDIRGTITTLNVFEDTTSILIEGIVEEDTGYDKASVSLPADGAVFAEDGSMASARDLAEGQRVEAWFTGPVAESYPVQATGEAVRILSE